METTKRCKLQEQRTFIGKHKILIIGTTKVEQQRHNKGGTITQIEFLGCNRQCAIHKMDLFSHVNSLLYHNGNRSDHEMRGGEVLTDKKKKTAKSKEKIS